MRRRCSALSQFATRHRPDIKRARDRLEDKFAGLWISDKVAPVAELQPMFDQMADLMANLGGRCGGTAAEMTAATSATVASAAWCSITLLDDPVSARSAVGLPPIGCAHAGGRGRRHHRGDR